MANTDSSFFVKSTCANALVHEALQRLLVRPMMKLVAVLVIVAASTVYDFFLAQDVNLMLFAGTIVRIQQKGKVVGATNAFALAAQ